MDEVKVAIQAALAGFKYEVTAMQNEIAALKKQVAQNTALLKRHGVR